MASFHDYGWSVSRLQSHYEEIVKFNQSLLAWMSGTHLTTGRPKVEATMESTSGFNYGISGSQLLSLSRQRSLSYRNQSINLLCKSMDWFLYDRDLRHERVNGIKAIMAINPIKVGFFERRFFYGVVGVGINLRAHLYFKN